MNPTAALMLSRSVEEERRRVLSHRQTWLDAELDAHAGRRIPLRALLRLALFARLSDAKA
jgi:hypothetical protein